MLADSYGYVAALIGFGLALIIADVYPVIESGGLQSFLYVWLFLILLIIALFVFEDAMIILLLTFLLVMPLALAASGNLMLDRNERVANIIHYSVTQFDDYESVRSMINKDAGYALYIGEYPDRKIVRVYNPEKGMDANYIEFVLFPDFSYRDVSTHFAFPLLKNSVAENGVDCGI